MINETILTFGKYKGEDATAVMSIDPKYTKWLIAQDWFAEKNPKIYQIINNINTSEVSCTPEHNALQARFLDDEYILKILKKCLFKQYSDRINKTKERIYGASPLYRFFEEEFLDSISIRNIKFETGNVDVRCEIIFNIKKRINKYEIRDIKELTKSEAHRNEIDVTTIEKIEDVVKNGKTWKHDYTLAFAIFELKPSIGDDYPDVLRQIKRYIPSKNIERKTFCSFVAYDKYTGTGVDEKTMKLIFKNENIYPVNLSQLDDIEEHLQ